MCRNVQIVNNCVMRMNTRFGTGPALRMGAILVGLVFAAQSWGQVAPGPLDVTSSLTPAYLAGRVVNQNSPDGIGASAYLNQPQWVTGCGGNLYFVDQIGLRKIELQTQRVTTILPGPIGVSIWCDGNFVFWSSTANGGQLTIQQLDVSTLQTSSLSFPAIAGDTLGTGEYVTGFGEDLDTTDSASGRVWRIDLQTHTRSVIADFGGPIITSDLVHPGRSFVQPVGPIWTNGSEVYLMHVQTAAQSVLLRIGINTGEMTPLLTGNFRRIWGQGATLYLTADSGISKYNLLTGDLSVFSSTQMPVTWSDEKWLYVTVSFLEGAVARMDPVTAQISVVAGDLYGDIDGTGSDARFAVYLLPASMQIAGDSRFLYISEPASVRRFDLATGVLSTVASGLTIVEGLWADDSYAYVSDRYAIRRIDLATKQVTTIAGSVAESGTADGIGTDARFGYLGALWGDGSNLYIVDHYTAIRKLELATGKVTTLIRDTGSSYRGIWGIGRSLYLCVNRMVRRLDLDTLQMETIAGNDSEGSVDGIGTAAAFTRADGVWGDGTSLFVVDAIRKIRRIDLASANVTTIYNSPETISTGIFGNGSHLYLMEGYSLRRYDPQTSVLTFGAPGQGLYETDLNSGSPIRSLHGTIQFAPGMPAMGAMAILQYRNGDGVLVSEAAVPAQAAIRNGRIDAEVQSTVNTGLALMNPGDADVRVDFYFTDANGTNSGSGSLVLGAHQELARFLTEAPFSGTSILTGAFTFSASAAVSAIAIRGRTNERSEFLMTTLPVVDLDAALSYDTATMAHFAAGGGWSTDVVLVNPTNQVISGTLQFVNAAGKSVDSGAYTLPAQSSAHFITDPASTTVQTGSVSVTPTSGNVAPVPLTIFRYNANGITVTESGVPASVGSELASYVEAGTGSSERTESGIAVANTTDQSVIVYLRLATTTGLPFGQNASIQLQPHAQIAKLLSELFPTLQLPFTGVLHVSSTGPISIIDLRITSNARGETIVSTVTPLNKAVPMGSTLYLPHLVDGGGFTSRVLFINPTGLWSAGTISLFATDGNATVD
jgi:hypothetical protein